MGRVLFVRYDICTLMSSEDVSIITIFEMIALAGILLYCFFQTGRILVTEFLITSLNDATFVDLGYFL